MITSMSNGTVQCDPGDTTLVQQISGRKSLGISDIRVFYLCFMTNILYHLFDRHSHVLHFNLLLYRNL